MGDMIAATLQSPASASASREFLRQISEVREGLAALNAGHRLHWGWRMPLYRSRAIAAAAGLRAAAYLVLASGFFVLAGWPSAEVSLSLVALVIGLGAVSPNPQSFTVAAFIAAPIAAVLAGTLEFLILDGVTEFPLLALALAPFVIGTMVVATRPHPMVASLGRLNLIFILVILSPSNPQSYNANSFLFVVLFLCTGIGLLLAAQTLIPPESIERRQRWIMASVRRDFELVLSKHDRRLAPEEAMFRDAARIGQITAGGASPQDSAVLAEALSYFDRAAAIRLGRESVARLAETSLSHLAAEAEEALAAEDTQRLRDMGLNLKDASAPEARSPKKSAVSSRSRPSSSTPRDTRPRPPWRPCHDALIFRAGHRRRIRRAVRRLRGGGARHLPRSSSDPASVRVRKAIQQSGDRRAQPLCDDPRPADGRFLGVTLMYHAKVMEQTVRQVEPSLPAQEPAAGSVPAMGRQTPLFSRSQLSPSRTKRRVSARPSTNAARRVDEGLRFDGSSLASSGSQHWPSRSSPSSWPW